MKLPEYMSPSSLKCFEGSQEEYYLRYMAENRPPRSPQTQPMSVGSAFDAYAKSYIHYALFGHFGKDNQYDFGTIFDEQVEPLWRDWAYEAGKQCFDVYKSSGALASMMLELKTAIGEPRFEFTIRGLISGQAGTVPLLGKPDIFFVNEEGARVILDWKVNGYCSQASPTPGYIQLLGKSHKKHGMCHDKCVIDTHKGLQINAAYPLEKFSPLWAGQLATYAWLLGEDVGSEQLVSGIDQITKSAKGHLLVTRHRAIISASHQFELLGRYCYAWGCITGGHFFKGMTHLESQKHCQFLDKKAETLCETDPFSKFLNACR